MATFKKIRPEPLVPESDNSVAIRTSRAYNRYLEHADKCAKCHPAGGNKTRCWQGQDLWNAARTAAERRYL